MGRIRHFWLLLLVPAVLFGRTGSSKYYYYPEIQTEVYLSADGSAHVIQQRAYEFHGSFTWAFVDLKKQGSEGIIFNSLAEQTPGGWQPIQPQELTDKPASLYIRWGYSAQSETKTFRLDYSVKGAVKRYADVADFYWKVIEDEHERVSHAHTEVFLPGPSPNLFKVYIHADAPPGHLEFSAAKDQAIIDQSGIPSNVFVEVRALADPALFPLVAASPVNRYQQILDEEKRNFTQSLVRKYVLLPLGIVALLIVPLILVLVFYFRYGREPKLAYNATYEHEPPRMAPPLAVPAIMHQKPEKSRMSQELFRGMFATLLDLARQRIVSVEETRDGHKKRFAFRLDKPDKVASLDVFGRTTAQFFFEEVARDGVVTPEDVKTYGQSHSTGIIAMLGELLDGAVDWWRATLGVDSTDPASRRAYRLYIVILVLVALAGILLLANGLMAFVGRSNPGAWVISGVVAVLIGFMYIRLGRSILRWSETAYLEHKRWRAFRKFLRDFSAIKDAPVTLLAIWEQYYVYATALGVAKEFLKSVTRLAREQGTGLALPAWYIMAGGAPVAGDMAGMAEGLASFESFASNFSGMVDSFSVATTSGGGFSGGGGGGGGGSSGAG